MNPYTHAIRNLLSTEATEDLPAMGSDLEMDIVQQSNPDYKEQGEVMIEFPSIKGVYRDSVDTLFASSIEAKGIKVHTREVDYSAESTSNSFYPLVQVLTPDSYLNEYADVYYMTEANDDVKLFLAAQGKPVVCTVEALVATLTGTA